MLWCLVVTILGPQSSRLGVSLSPTKGKQFYAVPPSLSLCEIKQDSAVSEPEGERTVEMPPTPLRREQPGAW